MSLPFFDQAQAARHWSHIIIRTDIVLTVLSTCSIAIRVLAKWQTKANFGLDDAFIFLAQAFMYATTGLHIKAADIGKDVTSMIVDPQFPPYTKWVTIAGMLYGPTIFCISASVLLFYRRIFPVQSIKRLVTIFLVLHALWFLTCFFGQVFICYPVDLAWADVITQSMNADKCMQYPKFFVAITSLELGLNAAVLTIPIGQTLKLQLNNQTKVALVGVFLLGGVSIISGIVRVVKTYIPNQPYIDLSGDMFWLALHVNTALIAASLPIYRPLLRASMAFMSSSIRKVYGSGYDSKRSAGSSNVKDSRGYTSMSDKQSQKSLVEKERDSADPIDRQIQMATMERPKRGDITVERSFEVV